ncbi:MAG: hypothetical protein M3Y33_07475 [Actinomycetota bacterium]|nr:hypothetical protein [Actinomycetota bacterium]
MELTTAMLADSAQTSDGKLYVLGGQWDQLNAAAVPVIHPAMAVVVVLRLDAEEAAQPHRLLVELLFGGEPVGPRAAGQVASHDSAAGAVSTAGAVSFANVTFEHAGHYEWVVRVDDDEVGRLPLDVLVETPAAVS